MTGEGPNWTIGVSPWREKEKAAIMVSSCNGTRTGQPISGEVDGN